MRSGGGDILLAVAEMRRCSLALFDRARGGLCIGGETCMLLGGVAGPKAALATWKGRWSDAAIASSGALESLDSAARGVAHMFSKPDRAKVSELGELAEFGGKVGERGSVTSGFLHTLPLTCNDEPTGSLVIHVLFMPAPRADVECAHRGTMVAPSMFESPVKRLGVSGGTAPFFALRIRRPKLGQSPVHFVGKDLSHSCEELAFYEDQRR